MKVSRDNPDFEFLWSLAVLDFIRAHVRAAPGRDRLSELRRVLLGVHAAGKRTAMGHIFNTLQDLAGCGPREQVRHLRAQLDRQFEEGGSFIVWV